MGDPRLLRRTGDTEIQIPNPALEAWLMSEDCRKEVLRVTNLIMVAYKNLLPYETGNLKAGAGAGIKNGPPRPVGYVLNKALSYRPTKGQPYPRFIEYGKPTKGIRGGHQLVRAAEMVAGNALERARIRDAEVAVAGGMSGAGTEHHQANPGRRKLSPAQIKEVQARRREAELRRKAEATDVQMADILKRARAMDEAEKAKENPPPKRRTRKSE